jgi:hypothetical protein
MVTKYTKGGRPYGEPPYTRSELLDFYETLMEPITFVASARPRAPVPEEPQQQATPRVAPQAPVQQEPQPQVKPQPQEPQQPQVKPRRGSRRGKRKNIWRGVDRP